MSGGTEERRARSIIVGEEPTSSKHPFDHEEVALPNPHSNPGDSRFGNATRTDPERGRAAQRRVQILATARGVTQGDAAEQSFPSGATLAVDKIQSRAQLDEPIVIEDDDDDVSSPTKPEPMPRRFSLERAMAEQALAQAWAAIRKNNARRATRKDTKPQDSSVRDYVNKCRLIDEAVDRYDQERSEYESEDDAERENTRSSDEATSLEKAMSNYAPARSSYEKMLSALKWRAFDKIKSVLRLDDQKIQQGWSSRVRDKWMSSVSTAVDHLNELEALSHKKLLRLSKQSARRSKSKREMMRRLPNDWRETFLEINARSATYRSTGLLMSHLGLRPWELQLGISVALDGGSVKTTILGAKVRETAGQPSRTVWLDAALMPAWFLAELGTNERVYSAKSDPMRAHFKRISREMFAARARRKPLIVSAYNFRHAKVTDLYQEGWTAVEIAEVMGESVAETVSWYGHRPRRGKQPLKPQAMLRGRAQVARPVRPRSTVWLRSVQAKTNLSGAKTVKFGKPR